MVNNRVLLSASLSLFFAFASAIPKEPLFARTSPDGRCGAGFNNYKCTQIAGAYQCCSQYNWCGDTLGHCGAGCQPLYGNCNSASSSSSSSSKTTTTTSTKPTTTSTPTATSTSKSTTSTSKSTSTSKTSSATPTSTARSKPGSVPYGPSIYNCNKPGHIALTYDDGPWIYTGELLDILARLNTKVTFFVTGNNLDKGAIDDPNSPWRAIIARAYNEGHQIASHTWDHLDLDSLNEADRRFQMTRLEQALMSIIGKAPTYMRPPFIRCGTACEKTMGALGYHTIIWDLDTDDYNNDSPELIENSKRLVREALAGHPSATTDWLSIAHDIHEQTVVSLTEYQITYDLAQGYKHVRMGDCLNDPEANWYRTV